jgi:23S rRNA (guanine2445-N2)-methyltransferase / 23S rRNA (guanine2069-N7)-methyltransferase
MTVLRFFATAPKGVPPVLAEELRHLGAGMIKEGPAGVAFEGPLALGYRACLWSRTASRVLMHLADVPAATPEALYDGIRGIDWSEHLAPAGTLLVDFSAQRSTITHTHFGALKVKDAIVDQFRERCGERPSIAREQPDLRVHVHVDRDQASVSLDLAGDSLHRRGYRESAVVAPLKQNLAAALLLRAGWDTVAATGGTFVDPMCGSGTLLIEAAMMAADIAPGLNRDYFALLRWRGHDAEAWRVLREEAVHRREAGLQASPPLFGFDADARAVRAARDNVDAAGIKALARIERRDIADVETPEGVAAGMFMVNPPYGERLHSAPGERAALEALYRLIGEVLKQRFEGWQAAVFTGNPPLGKYLGLKARRTHTFYNGAIECRLLRFQVTPEWFEKSAEARAVAAAQKPLSEGAEMFGNRLRKNLRTLGRWAAREGISCYRLYDADMPEYAVAVDLYQGDGLWAHVQEYAPPASVDPEKARLRFREIVAALPQVLEIPRERIVLKRRERQRGTAQYTRKAQTGEYLQVAEGACRLLVNLKDYLDTGLFLDHRSTRALLGGWSRGRDCLNLFCYTATASVYMALGGAASTTSVDMSATYLDWARRNFALNGMDPANNLLVQADCLQWLDEQQHDRKRYGLIFLDPPTFSNSKRMQDTLDVQRDHVELISAAAKLLSPGGLLVFSTNRVKFRLDADAMPDLAFEDITRSTIPKDFERNPHIHRCYRISRG